MSFITRSRWSDVYIASATQFLGALGTFLAMVTLILAFQQRGASGVEVSALVIAEALPMVALGRYIGRLIDRVDSRTLLVLAGLGQIAACLALSQLERFEHVVAAAVALSLASAVATPTRQALLPAMVVRDDLPKASAIGQTAGSAGMMIGPALAGFMVGGLGVGNTLEIAAIGFGGTVAAGLLLRTRRGGPSAATATEDQKPSDGYRLSADRLLWSSVWGLTSVIAAISAVNVVLVFFILDTLHSSSTVYGLIDSMWTVGVLAGAWLFSRFIHSSTGDGTLALRLFAVLASVSVVIVAIGSVSHASWIVPFYLVGGAFNGGLNVLMGTLVGRRAPAHARGRVNTALSSRVQAGAMVGFIAGGLFMEVSPPRWIVIGCGVLGVVVVLAVLPLLRPTRFRGRSATPEDLPVG